MCRTPAYGAGRRDAVTSGPGNRWEILAEDVPMQLTQMAYDPVHRRLVGWGSAGPGGTVLAFDPAARAWTVLLAPR